MASESAVLGTPSIYANELKAGSINEQKKRGLVFQTLSLDKILAISKKILKSSNSEKYFRDLTTVMLSQKIDLTKYLCNFVLSRTTSDDI